MKKANKLVVFLFVFLLSCGSRKVATDKRAEKLEQRTEQATEQHQESQKESNFKILEELQGFEFNGLNQPFKLSYKGLSLEGHGSVKFNGKKEAETKEKTKVVTWIKTYTITNTVWMSKTKYKKVESKRDSFWLYVLIGFGGIVIWEIIRRKIKWF